MKERKDGGPAAMTDMLHLAPSEKSGGLEPVAGILVVEDDYFVAQDTCALLTDAGFEIVAVAARGEEAIEAARTLRPDLTLMDITLAGHMDGIDAAIALRQMGLPVIFASAHTDPTTLARGAKADPLGWLSKPFDQAAVVRAVSAALISAVKRNADEDQQA